MLRKRSSRVAGFTLIEVLVVTGIMMSQTNNYGEVKRIAYQQSCENNLRQLYMALQMYDDSSGGLPGAKFFAEDPKKDAKSLYNILDSAYQTSLVCPVFPPSIKDKGCTYIYNDALAGQTLDSVTDARATWLLTELNAVSDKIPMPHPRGFNVLYADGHVEATKAIPPALAEMQKKAEEEAAKKAAAKGAKPDPKKPDASGPRPSKTPDKPKDKAPAEPNREKPRDTEKEDKSG